MVQQRKTPSGLYFSANFLFENSSGSGFVSFFGEISSG
jgi:hypothetical protein